jgi:hypothetical protein
MTAKLGKCYWTMWDRGGEFVRCSEHTSLAAAEKAAAACEKRGGARHFIVRVEDPALARPAKGKGKVGKVVAKGYFCKDQVPVKTGDLVSIHLCRGKQGCAAPELCRRVRVVEEG